MPNMPTRISGLLYEEGKVVRSGKRSTDQMRPVEIHPHFISSAEGSALIRIGETQVICTASVDEGVPAFLKGQGKGWVTSEYGMIPRATDTRTRRESSQGRQGGRTHEIQRLIGRSLRGVTDLEKLGERTVWIDCDVIRADGGTRTASITGAFVALGLAYKAMKEKGAIRQIPLTDAVAAVSVGLVGPEVMLDLDYGEDSNAEVDMNVVMTGSGKLVEVQATAEGRPFSREELDRLVEMAQKGIQELLQAQNSILNFSFPKHG